jgi:hypothetical protein
MEKDKNYIKAFYKDIKSLRSDVKDLEERNIELFDLLFPNSFENFNMRGNDNIIAVFGAVFGFLGAALAFLFQWYTITDYPLTFGGKPNFTWLTFIPVTFEFGILFAAIAMFITFCIKAGLIPGKDGADLDNTYSIIVKKSTNLTDDVFKRAIKIESIE